MDPGGAMLTTNALGQVSQWTVGPVEHFLEADIDQEKKKERARRGGNGKRKSAA